MWNDHDKTKSSQGTSGQFSLGSQRRPAYNIQRHSDRVVHNSFEVKRGRNYFSHNPITLHPNKTSMSILANVKQEHEETTDESSGSDEDDQDGIVEFCNDIKNHKKLLKKLQKEKELNEKASKSEMDQLIHVQKRLASELQSKYRKENMAMSNHHAKQRAQLEDRKRIKLENITRREKEISRKLKISRKELRERIKRNCENEEDFAPECPLCMEIMTPPKKIYQCSEGHMVCSVCKPKMQNDLCATCRNENGYNSRCRWIEDNIAKRMKNK